MALEIVPLPVLVSTEDVVERDDIFSPGRSIISLTGQDVLSRVTRTVSDYSAEWPTQAVGRDPFTDDTGTGYGGMKYMAGIEGNWQAQNGTLSLISSMHRSIAENVQIVDTLNGTAAIGIKLNDHTIKEYGGIAFHILDKDNYFYVIWDIESDTIILGKNVTGGSDVVYATSAVMGWASETSVYHYLRVTVRYARVFVQTSDDGIYWTDLAWATGVGEIPGTVVLSTVAAEYTNWSGKFGVIGKGYSDVDQPPPIDPPPWPPPTPTPPPYSGDAQIQWMVHNRPGSTPPLAVIYVYLNDVYNPVYKAIIPPGELHLTDLAYGNYYSTSDTLMLIGYASSTPSFPGWDGGASNVLIKVTGATRSAPVWSLSAWGFYGISVQEQPAGVSVAAVTAPVGGHLHGSLSMQCVGLTAHIGPCSLSVVPSGASGDAIYISNGSPSLQWGYLRANAQMLVYGGYFTSTFSGNVGTTPRDAQLPETSTYAYQVGHLQGSKSLIRYHFMRRRFSDGVLQICYTDIMGMLGGTLPVFVDHTLDETFVTEVGSTWCNTHDASDYFNVIVHMGSDNPLYYHADGLWHKAPSTVPYGVAFYAKSAGGNGMVWVGQGEIVNGNEPVRYKADITDAATGWVGMAGNMWSGDNKIISAGNLGIVDSWLSY